MEKCQKCSSFTKSTPNHGSITLNKFLIQTIDVTVQLTATHKGWFEFHLCVVDEGINNLADTCIPGFAGLHKLSSPNDVNRIVSCQVQHFITSTCDEALVVKSLMGSQHNSL